MSASDAAESRRLEQYPPDTAGGIMTPQVTALAEDLTVEQAIAELRRLNEEAGADVLRLRGGQAQSPDRRAVHGAT